MVDFRWLTSVVESGLSATACGGKDLTTLVVVPPRCVLYELIPNMPERRLAPLINEFAEAAVKTGLFSTAIAASKYGDG